jgi:hypothetical protein
MPGIVQGRGRGEGGVRRIGWRVTPASVLPTLVAFVLAGFLGLPGGSMPGVSPARATPAGAALVGAALAGPSVSAPVHAATTRPTAPVHAATTRPTTQAQTHAPATGRASMGTDPLRPSRLAQTGGRTPGHADPGAALAALAYRLSLDRLGRLLPLPTGGHPAGTTFSSFRSRAPPRISW